VRTTAEDYKLDCWLRQREGAPADSLRFARPSTFDSSPLALPVRQSDL
jgi:hypothetical protein